MDPQDMQISWEDSYALYESERLEAPDPERRLLDRESFEIIESVILQFYRKYCPGRGAVVVLILLMLAVYDLSIARIAKVLGLEHDCVLHLAEEGEEIVRDFYSRGELEKEADTARKGGCLN